MLESFKSAEYFEIRSQLYLYCLNSSSIDMSNDVTDEDDSARKEAQIEQFTLDWVKNKPLSQELNPSISSARHCDAGKSRCKPTAFIKHAAKYTVIDLSGKKLVGLINTEVKQKLRNKEIKPIENNVVFDQALESVIDGMRGDQ